MPRTSQLHEVRTRDRALLVALEHNEEWRDDLDELRQLATTAGVEIVEEFTQRRRDPATATYLGAGKLEELAAIVQETGANLVIVDGELSPTQHRNFEDAVEARVIDRTQLILDIFAQRARTAEGKLQVELAQLTYLMPRLAGQGTALSRLGGGAAGAGTGSRGPGETKLELDRRRIRGRVSDLKKELNEVQKRRGVQRSSRDSLHMGTVSLIGYTSAGKSTLLNRLAGSEVYTDPKLFATLDPTTRRVRLPSGRDCLMTDTVGFIRQLPTHLVAAFRATLEEAMGADVLIHVVDASSPRMDAQMEAVNGVLADLGAADKFILTALNKTDQIKDWYELRRRVASQPNTVYVSALSGDGADGLLKKLEDLIRNARSRRRARPAEERVPSVVPGVTDEDEPDEASETDPGDNGAG
jgi:GTPase